MAGDMEAMPRNLVGDGSVRAEAEMEGISEEEWRARNLPAEKLVLRWRYANREIQLYERRLRSLRAYNVGPAVQAWIRSRMEWVSDNKLYEQPNGVVELTIDPEGDVDIALHPHRDQPVFSREQLVFEGGVLRGCELGGTVWASDGESLVPSEPGLRAAADTLVRDLGTTLGFAVGYRELFPADVDGMQLLWVSDEFGAVACEDAGGPVAEKLVSCFDKLYS